MSKLNIRAVRSYRSDKSVILDLSKRINLVYGQNGSGKSTISGYFYKSDDEAYKNCSFECNDEYKFIVYNSQFVEDSFYNKSEQPGIFTLSQENKEGLAAIVLNNGKIASLKKKLSSISSELEKKEEMIDKVKDSYQTDIWNKTAHIRKKDGGLGELMVGFLQKATFFQRVSQQIDMKDTDTLNLTFEYGKLKDNKNTTYDTIVMPPIPKLSDEQINILSLSLTASGDSYLSVLIDKLGNADWIRTGLEYIEDEHCPFCQEKTINERFKSEVKKIFDDSYDQTIHEITNIYTTYKEATHNYVDAIKASVSSNSYITDKNEILNIVDDCNVIFQSNLKSIQEKLDKPSQCIDFVIENPSLDILIQKIENYNSEIHEINLKVNNYDVSVNELKTKLWRAIRFICNDLIETYGKQLLDLNAERESILSKNRGVLNDIEKLSSEVISLSQKVSNIDETIRKINRTLKSLGIVHFKLKKKEESDFFQICRDNGIENNIYKTLSEGEKTLITFLYFLELCDGRLGSETNSSKEKLIVIDDPISSLSHDYIYEISSLIHHRLIKKNENTKIVILTHNLFFFQELIKVAPTKKDVFDKKYQLYRVIKDQYSDILTINRDEIKNEYEALWMVLKDVKQGKLNPIVLPNIMRNILEYYFSFSCKMEKLSEELDNLVSSETDINYKTFYRYINRGSHSDSINISNLGQISANKYLEMFEGIFKKTNDEKHFNKMLGLEIEEFV